MLIPKAGLFAGLIFILYSGNALATTYQVSIDAHSSGPITVGVAFDLVDGGPPANSISITNFITDSALGTTTTTGNVLGTLPAGVTLSDTTFFTEEYQVINAAQRIAFDFSFTPNAPSGASTPDAFSFFLLDPNTNLPLFNTTDPTLSGALFALQIDGSYSGQLANYAATDSPISWQIVSDRQNVPEPSTVLLMTIGMIGAWVRRAAKSYP